MATPIYLENLIKLAQEAERVERLSNDPCPLPIDTPSTSFSRPVNSRGQDMESIGFKNGRNRKGNGCGFCKRNGERSEYWKNHSLKVDGKVTCPMLFKHACELCGATGERAHTRSYCPVSEVHRDLNASSPLPSKYMYYNVAILKQVGHNSAGRFLGHQ